MCCHEAVIAIAEKRSKFPTKREKRKESDFVQLADFPRLAQAPAVPRTACSSRIRPRRRKPTRMSEK